MDIRLDTAELLMAEGFENVFIGTMFEGKDNIISIYHAGGAGQTDLLDGNFYESDLKILVRDNSTKTAYEKAYNIQSLLHNAYDNIKAINNNIEGYRILSDISNLGQDDKQRYMYSMNFICFTNK